MQHVTRHLLVIAGCWLMIVSAAPMHAAPLETDPPQPPPLRREFRGAWVATVANIDWPSKPGLTVARQQSELLALLDHVVRLNMNAIVLQVRPNCDAVYASALEPWSAWLTGRQGQPPEPRWDPLEFAVVEAHRRGLELHAWVNPYRAGRTVDHDTYAENHISRTHPELVRTYGKSLWLDPGEPAVLEHVVRIVRDVVARYDIDGVHMDDYFYPYRELDAAGRPIEFPDEATWQAYRRSGGTLARDDWRRDNVNRLVKRLRAEVQDEKSWVKVGISPFGIWRPGHPEGVVGLDAYDTLYADARLWLNEGWIDYLAPQLYWPREPAAQSFTALLDWWTGENTRGRHLWPGINTRRSAQWGPGELSEQIRLTRRIPTSCGAIHWNIGALAHNTGGVADALGRGVYAEPVVMPASPWLDDTPPGRPLVRAAWDEAGACVVHWEAGDPTESTRWVVQSRRQAAWTCRVFPAGTTSWRPPADSLPDTVAVYALDCAANLGEPALLSLPRPMGR